MPALLRFFFLYVAYKQSVSDVKTFSMFAQVNKNYENAAAVNTSDGPLHVVTIASDEHLEEGCADLQPAHHQEIIVLSNRHRCILTQALCLTQTISSHSSKY